MERFKEALHIALNNLLTNVVRSALSILGVVIGIAAVITVLSIGAGARNRIMEQIHSLGVNVFYVSGRYDETSQRIGQFELEDVRRLEELPFVLTALPQLNLYKVLRSRVTENRGTVVGVDGSYLEAKGLTLFKGRPIAPIEFEERRTVCLISAGTERTLFPDGESAVGQALFIEGQPWNIVGVYARKGLAKRAARAGGDLEVLAPLSALLRTTKDISIQSVEVHVKPDADESVKAEIQRSIERDDPKRKNLFYVRDQREFYARSLEVQNTLSLIGALVAGVSLIVGGIGMMNVMLTSVAERTREIGVRRAVGARKKDILFQFLVESCVLSGVGGVMGLFLGAALARGLPRLFKEFFDVAPRMQPSFLLLAVGTGMFLGVAFGFYPAVKASKLSPAEALRTE